jgi:hypothetical protein
MTNQRRPGFRLPWTDDAAPHPFDPTLPAAASSDEASAAPEPAMSDQTPMNEAAAAAGSVDVAADEAAGSEEFLHSLVDAMRSVAEESRDANLAELRRSVDERIEQVRAAAAERAEELRRVSDLDVAATSDWERAEMDRVKTEAERRVAARRAELERQLAEQQTSSDRDIEAARSRLADYERDLSAFFDQLSEIRDPAAFVAAAKRMPRGPDLVAAPSQTASVPAAAPPMPAPAAESDTETPPADLVAQRAIMVPSAEPAAAEAVEPVESVEPTPDQPEAEAPSASVAVEEAGPAAEASDPNARLAERLAELDQRLTHVGTNGDAARGPQDDAAAVSTSTPSDAPVEAMSAEADVPAETSQQGQMAEAAVAEAAVAEEAVAEADDGEMSTPIMVKGLGSFGAITSFKQALERAEGIHGVTLSLGPGGEFVYRASHATGFDLIGAIRAIEGQGANIDETDGSLLVTINRGR